MQSGSQYATPIHSWRSRVRGVGKIWFVVLLFYSFLLQGAPDLLGHGSFGQVSRIVGPDGQAIAVKKQSWDRSSSDAAGILNEGSILFGLSDPGLLKGLGCSREGEYLNYETPCYDADLHRELHSGGDFTPGKIQYFMAQILRGLAFLHSHDLVHCDIKPSNIFVNKATNGIVLGDFGSLWHVTVAESGRLKHRKITTQWYRAPELLGWKVAPGSTLRTEAQDRAARFNTSADMFSAGCVLAEMLTKAPLFQEDDEREIAILHKSWSNPDQLGHIPSRFSRNAALVRSRATELGVLDLLDGLLALDPHRRLSAPAALSMDYVRKSGIGLELATTPKGLAVAKCLGAVQRCRLLNPINTSEKWLAACKDMSRAYPSILIPPAERALTLLGVPEPCSTEESKAEAKDSESEESDDSDDSEERKDGAGSCAVS